MAMWITNIFAGPCLTWSLLNMIVFAVPVLYVTCVYGEVVTVDFDDAPSQDLDGNPYVEDDFKFEEVLGGTSHISPTDGFLALGDWTSEIETRVRVEHNLGQPFDLLRLDYYVTYFGEGSGQLEFASSKGGEQLVNQGSSIDFTDDPLWETISWFTVTGIPGTDTHIMEASIDNVELEAVPEPSSLI